jgi:catechol 2,3-dioxygenase-like lactoylglutathione lyase family enzyme
VTISVRYIVDNVEDAIPFYTEHLGFTVEMHPAPGFAALSRGELRLLLNQPGAGGAGQLSPRPGGWNRFQLQVEDIEATVARMKSAGVKLRSEVITGNGGKQVLAEDPAGNPVELFQPVRA